MNAAELDDALDVEFSDRYGPAGAPSLRVGCRGPCEATGWVPIYLPEGDTRPADRTRIDANGTEFHITSAISSSKQRLPSDSSDVVFDPRYVALWRAAEAEEASGDGWHFVRCLDCDGTGRTHGWQRVAGFFWWLRSGWRFFWSHVFSIGYAYGDREDKSWWWNRKLALRVLLGRVR